MKRKSQRRLKKINKYAIRRIIALVILVIIILLIKNIISFFINKNNEKELSIIINNEIINTKKEVIIEEDKDIYFSKEDVQEIFDNTIYYNEAEKELITTYNKHTALLKIDESFMMVNDSKVDLNGTLRKISETVYLPMNDLEIVYDLEIQYAKENNTIIIDSTSKEKREAITTQNLKVKNQKGWFKKTIEKIEQGETVVVLETVGNYKKVRTKLGTIGYISAKKVANEIVIREDMIDEVQKIKVYKEYSNISGIYENISVEQDKLNIVIPTFFYLDKNSRVLDKTRSTTATYANYQNWINENKLTILPTLENNKSVSSTLLTYNQRNEVINSLYNQIVKYQYKGININFETIDDINSFYRFIIELTPRFKESGLIVAVTLNENLDKSRIQKITDYIIED